MPPPTMATFHMSGEAYQGEWRRELKAPSGKGGWGDFLVQVDLPQEVGVARIVADRIEERLDPQVDDVRRTLIDRTLQALKSQVALPQTGVEDGEKVGILVGVVAVEHAL